jgi:Metallopeptidase family M24
MKRMRLLALILVLATVPAVVTGQPKTGTSGEPKLLPWSQQIAVREQWLKKRHGMILDMMRRHDVGMWIIVNEEFHNDPLTEHIAPPRIYAGGRDIFMFIDAGDKGLRKIAFTGYAEDNLKEFFESTDDPRPVDKQFAELYAQYKPKKIALSFGGNRGVTRSLTYTTYKWLAEKFGPEAESHFVPAADLIEEYSDTRIPEEFATYTDMVNITESIAKRSLSGEVIKPGTTTVGDVRNWLYDELGRHDLTTWFQPDVRVQRKGMPNPMSRGFLAVSPESVVIQKGDVVHLDFGITYMGLNTDWQKMSYVLRDGEKDVPVGLKKALANTNALQDAVCRQSKPGKAAGDVYNDVLAEMKEKGIEAKVYSHPLGFQGHALGASIDYRSAQRSETMPTSKKLRDGSYIAIELNALTAVPEWDGQKVFVMEEDPAYLTQDGWKFFVPRQTEWYVVK